MLRLAKCVSISLLFVAFGAYGDDTTKDAVIGGAAGGAIGAAVGSELGDREGAIVGAAVGAAVGTAITTQEHDKEHDHDHHDHHDHAIVVEVPADHPHDRHCPPGQAKKGRC